VTHFMTYTIVEKRDRSKVIDKAVRRYIGQVGKANLRKQLKEGALRNASRDRAIARCWLSLESGTNSGSC